MRILAALLCVVVGLGAVVGCTGSPRELFTGDRPVDVRPDDAEVLRAGDSVEGELTATRPRRAYPIEVGEGQGVTIGVIGVDSGFDAYVRVYDTRGALVVEDDDGGDGLDSLAEVATTATAGFVVEVASYRDDDTGRYLLRLQADAPGSRPAPAQVLVNDRGEVAAGSAEAARFAFQGTEGEQITIAVDTLSSDLDPIVTLLGPGGATVGRDDDSGGNRNALLDTQLSTAGTHVAVVSDFGDDDEGEFTILVTTSRRPGSLTGPVGAATPRPLTPSPR